MVHVGEPIGHEVIAYMLLDGTTIRLGFILKKMRIISNSNQFHASFASSSIYIIVRPKIFFNVLIHARRCSPSP